MYRSNNLNKTLLNITNNFINKYSNLLNDTSKDKEDEKIEIIEKYTNHILAGLMDNLKIDIFKKNAMLSTYNIYHWVSSRDIPMFSCSINNENYDSSKISQRISFYDIAMRFCNISNSLYDLFYSVNNNKKDIPLDHKMQMIGEITCNTFWNDDRLGSDIKTLIKKYKKSSSNDLENTTNYKTLYEEQKNEAGLIKEELTITKDKLNNANETLVSKENKIRELNKEIRKKEAEIRRYIALIDGKNS